MNELKKDCCRKVGGEEANKAFSPLHTCCQGETQHRSTVVVVVVDFVV